MAYQEWECPHCGTQWAFEATSNRSSWGGSAAGFIWAHIIAHKERCAVRTVEERLAWIAFTRRRVARRPPIHTRYEFSESRCVEYSRPTPLQVDAAISNQNVGQAVAAAPLKPVS